MSDFIRTKFNPVVSEFSSILYVIFKCSLKLIIVPILEEKNPNNFIQNVNVKGFGLSSLPIIIGILSEFTLIGNLKNSSSLELMHWPSDITYPLLHL